MNRQKLGTGSLCTYVEAFKDFKDIKKSDFPRSHIVQPAFSQTDLSLGETVVMGFMDSKYIEAVDLIQMLDHGNRQKKDKRRAPRLEIRLKLKIRVMNNNTIGPAEAAELRDLSPRGLRLIVDRKIESNSAFVIRLPGRPDAPPTVPLICRVVHCTAQSNGTFSIGAEFTGRLPDGSPRATDEKKDDAEALRISGKMFG